MAEQDLQALTHPQYWDAHYVDGDGATPTHEWFRSYEDLSPFLTTHLLEAEGCKPEDKPLILHIGTGDSLIPIKFESLGYHRQLCLDFSPVVINLMRRQYSHLNITWLEGDVRHMVDVADGSVDVAFDKGTLDAMIHGSPWNPPEEVKDNTSKYMKEVYRVLKNNGRFLYVTFRQAHFMRPILNPDGVLWDMEMHVLSDVGSFDYFGYVLRKKCTGAGSEVAADGEVDAVTEHASFENEATEK